ncbi:MATE family efflux transporter [Roseburia hominis]
MEQHLYRKQFMKYAFFGVLGTLGVSCYILADTFFIAKGLGMRGLTALNLAIPAYNFIHGTGLMIGMGGGTRFSICRNDSNRRRIDEIFMNSVYLGLFLGVLFALAGLRFSQPLAILLGADSETLAMTSVYLKWLCLFAPAFIMNNILLCFVRNDRSPMLSSAAMLVGSFSNIALDYIFIFPMHMGMFGAVFATGLSPVISMAVLSRHWKKPDKTLRIIRARFNPEIIRSNLALGFPSLIGQVASGTAMIVFNILILKIEGNVGVAAYGVIANISLVVASVYTGVSQGIQPLISDSYGKGESGQIQLGMKYSNITIVILSGIMYLFIFLFADGITSVFNGEQNIQMQNLAVNGLRLYFLSSVFAGYNTAIAIFFTSTERALPAHILSLLRAIVLLVPIAFLMSELWGMTGIWLTYPVTEVLAACAGYVIYNRKTILRKRRKDTTQRK